MKRFFLWLLNLLPHVTILREKGQPYLTRWCLLGGSPYDTNHPWFPFNVFVHRFQASDGTDPHNHPWGWARALILWGSYREHRALYMPPSIWIHQTFNPGDWNRLDDEIFHHVTLQTPE